MTDLTTPTVVRGVCAHDCPDSCGWLVTVDDSGKATKLRGDPSHPFSKGELCPKVNRYLDRVYSPDRILTPLRRTGPKGSTQFEPITWDEALHEIGQRMTGAIETHGGGTVLPFVSAGSQGTMATDFPQRLWNRMGAARITGSLCGTVAAAGTALTLGTGMASDPSELEHAKLVILWGTNTKLTNRHLWPTVEAARANGAQIVVIDPVRTVTADAADWFLQPLPGTDIALVLAMAHVVIRDGHVDHDWASAHTEGYDDFAAHVADWTPARAAEICGLPQADVERLCDAYATTRPSFIRALIGAEHREHGAMIYRSLACLPAVTGDWQHRGGGYARSVGTWMSTVTDEGALTRPDLRPPEGRRPVGMAQLGDALTDDSLDPPITVMLLLGGNPAVTAPDANRVRAGMARDDLFTVVHEQYLTDSARYADVVLPATTQVEVTDVVPPWGHLYLGWNDPAIAPVGESVSNAELCRRLARRLGYTEQALFDDDETVLTDTFGAELVAAMRRDGPQRIATYPEGHLPYAEGGFATPSGKLLLRADHLAHEGHPVLPTYQEPAEGTGRDPRFPFNVVTGKVHTRFLNTSYAQLPNHGGREGEPRCELDPADAERLGVEDGQMVRVFNDRGSLDLRARIGNRVRPGVVLVPWGWWGDAFANGQTANGLTNPMLTDWGGGAAYLDTAVAVAPI